MSAISSPTSPAVPNVDRMGWLRKRGGRMHRWSVRYFILSGQHIVYKLKPEGYSNYFLILLTQIFLSMELTSTHIYFLLRPIRGTFDLSPGCAVTSIEESRGGIGNHKMYSFWVVWPYEKNEKKNEKNVCPNDSNAKAEPKQSGDDSEGEEEKHKDLKQIVQREKVDYKEQHKRVEENIERHLQQDNSLSLGVKVAAVAVGGVVVGALTAGIGLVPYITVVGLTAVAGGGAVALQYRKPSDSRLILSCESMSDAIAWKQALEDQILKLEKQKKPMLPASVDPTIIAGILGMGAGYINWRKAGYIEGIRVLELVGHRDAKSTRARRSQVVINRTPISVFLAAMEISPPYWPKNGEIKVSRVVDDHADLLDVKVMYGKLGHRQLRLSRFWKLDDDGTYLITYNSITGDNRDSIIDTSKNAKEKSLHIDAVITISPRRDNSDFDEDLRESLVTCSIQVTFVNENLYVKEVEDFMNDFLSQLIELRLGMFTEKFNYERLRNSPHAVHGTPTVSEIGNTFSVAVPKQTAQLISPQQIPNKSNQMSKLFRIKNNATTTQEHPDSATPVISSPGIPEAPIDGTLLKIPNLSTNSSFYKGANNTSDSNLRGLTAQRSSRKRTTQVNKEASALRAQIAAKEYEVQRFSKLVKKRSGAIQVQSKKASSLEVDKQSEDTESLSLQITELKRLQSKYVQLTGMSYGDSVIDRKRERRVRIGDDGGGTLARMRSFGFGSSSNRDTGRDGKEFATIQQRQRQDSVVQDANDILSRVRAFSTDDMKVETNDDRNKYITPLFWHVDDYRLNRTLPADAWVTVTIAITFIACFVTSLEIENILKAFV